MSKARRSVAKFVNIQVVYANADDPKIIKNPLFLKIKDVKATFITKEGEKIIYSIYDDLKRIYFPDKLKEWMIKDAERKLADAVYEITLFSGGYTLIGIREQLMQTCTTTAKMSVAKLVNIQVEYANEELIPINDTKFIQISDVKATFITNEGVKVIHSIFDILKRFYNTNILKYSMVDKARAKLSDAVYEITLYPGGYKVKGIYEQLIK